MKKLVLIVMMLIGWVSSEAQQGNSCYIIKGDFTGITNMHNQTLFDTVCNFVGRVDGLISRHAGSTRFSGQFKVITTVNPVLNGDFIDSYTDKAKDAFFKDAEESAPYYLALYKEQNYKTEMRYEIKLKLPETGVFANINILQRQAIEQQVESAMHGGYLYFGSNFMGEIMGYTTLFKIIEQLEAGTYNADIFTSNDFMKSSLSNISTLIRSSNIESRKEFGKINIVNYGTITDGGIDIADFGSSLGNIDKIKNFSVLIIYTSKKDTDKFNEAFNLFNSSDSKFKVWIHIDNELLPPPTIRGNGGGLRSIQSDVYFLTANKFSEGEAGEILNDLTKDQSKWTNDPSKTFTVGDPDLINEDCNLSWKYGWNCLLPQAMGPSGIGSTPVIGSYAIVCGILDGLLGTLEGFFTMVKGTGSILNSAYNSIYNFTVDVIKNGIDLEALKRDTYNSIKAGWASMQAFTEEVSALALLIYNKDGKLDYIKNLATEILNGIHCFFSDFFESETFAITLAYGGGLFVFEALAAYFTGGASTAGKGSKFTAFVSDLKGGKVGNYISKLLDDNPAKRFLCKLKIIGGCFIKDTPVLMANKNHLHTLKNTGMGLAMAAMPMVSAVPIQDVQLLDYAVAHTSVNNRESKVQDRLTASTDDTYYGLIDANASGTNDPYTSDQQRQRDLYELNDTDWHEVVFEQVHGTSSCKLALHHDWMVLHGYSVDAVVNLNLPEQGISGPFKITSIRHIIPQKRPVDEDESDDYTYKPVTALFTHVSDQVYTLSFDNGDTIGVTANHPIYSHTASDWRLAGELVVGEQVLTYHGIAVLTSTTKNAGSELVYNLEVKDLHNFLVGERGVVVHNTGNCMDLLFNFYKRMFKNADDVTHILKGKVKNGYAGGAHHKGAFDSGTARVRPGTTKSTPNQHGVYEAQVDIKDANGNFIPKTESSTFFPDAWDEMRTMENILHAWENYEKVPGTTNVFRGFSIDGNIVIEMYLRPDGSIISAFPKL